MVAGRRVRVLVSDGRRHHLVVALRAGAGLVGALRGRGGVRRVLLCVVPADTKTGAVRDFGLGGAGGYLLAPRVRSHGGCARGLGVVLRVDLRGRDFGVTGGLRVGGASIALGGGGGLVVEAKVVLLIVPAEKQACQRTKKDPTGGVGGVTWRGCWGCWGPRLRSALASCCHRAVGSGSRSGACGFL